MRSLLVLVALCTTASADVLVVLRDHQTGKPLLDKLVRMTQPQTCSRGQPGGCVPAKPRKVSARTDKQGVATFKVTSDWTLDEVKVAGYVTGCPYSNGLDGHVKHKLWVDIEATPDLPRRVECRLVPKAALTITSAQAIEKAAEIPEIKEWLATHALKPTARLVDIYWDVSWGTPSAMKRLVEVDALDGSAEVRGRWGD